jgi:EAL domain-containing protein (putative c-di-GMP-specific phosphodiesterase class I)
VTTPGRLFLWCPLGHSFGKLAGYLRQFGRSFHVRPEAKCVVVELGDGDATAFCEGVSCALTGEEVRGTRALFKPGAAEPGLADYGRVSGLAQFLALGRAGWLVAMLRENRLTSHFQPIVHAADPSRVYAHEALLRGLDSDGSTVTAGPLIDAARGADMLFQLDLAARMSALRSAVREGLRTPLFVNFNPTSVYDPVFCLRSTVELVRELGLRPADIVFEVVETDHSPDLEHLRSIINYFRDGGFRVALDDLGAGYSSLNLIHQLRPDIVKLDREMVSGIDREPAKDVIVRKIVEMAQQLNLLTVAEGLERPEELAWARANGVDLVQGYLLGRPAARPMPQGAPTVGATAPA